MKKWIKYLLVTVLAAISYSWVLKSCPFQNKHQRQDLPTIKIVDPLVKVLKYDKNIPIITGPVDVARGEYATFQFVLKSGQAIKGLKASYRPASSGAAQLKTAKIGFVDYVKLTSLAMRSPSTDRIRSDDRFYPDPILNKAPQTIPANTNQSVWVSIPISLENPAGLYTGKIIFEGSSGGRTFKQEQTVRIQVYNVKITGNTLLTSNWMFYENRYSPPFAKLRYMNNGKEVQPYSPLFWELLEVIAKNMQAYRQNVFYVSPVRETKYTLKGGRYTFDFSNFDRLVSLFKRYGVAKYIEGGHIGGRDGAWDAPLVVNYMEPDASGVFQMKNLSVDDPRARGFYAQFIPALVKHLKAKGWYATYFQHLIDEPGDADALSYKKVSKMIKGFAPDLKVIDALSTTQITGNIDVWVPLLNYLAENERFFQERRNKGEMVWLYTCWLPQGQYANRFIELPALKNRLLPWISFKYNIQGNLNWGYNYWVDDPYQKADRTDGGSILPGGDSWLVYPAYKALHTSIRQELMRDGTFDYELLRMLKQKNNSKSASMADEIIYSFDRYNLDIKNFRAVRKRLLLELSR